MKYKLTASAISAFLKSPASYKWAYLAENGRGLEPPPSTQYYSHDLVFGQVWGEYVGAFYARAAYYPDAHFIQRTLPWCDRTLQAKYCDALLGLVESYAQQFSPDDGARTPDSSERRIENERFYGLSLIHI